MALSLFPIKIGVFFFNYVSSLVVYALDTSICSKSWVQFQGGQGEQCTPTYSINLVH